MPQWTDGKAFIHFQTGFHDIVNVGLLKGPVCNIYYHPVVRKHTAKKNILILNQSQQEAHHLAEMRVKALKGSTDYCATN